MNFKRKLAVCLPSYNESKNIKSITIKLDKYLNEYKDQFDLYIVNADSNSEDGTNNFFESTTTKLKKVSLISHNRGKGYNILNFINWCKKNKIDYAIMIDADVTSLTKDWIEKYIQALTVEKYDYVVPMYRRSRYEGSTTNHFAMPIVYALTGCYIRQPIAGDFAFNKRFIDLIANSTTNDSVKKYGIDIFMTLTACFNKLNVGQIELGKKIHNPSYNKMENMFLEVMDTALFTIKQYDISDIKYDEILENDNILKSRKFNHKQRAIELNNLYKIDNVDIDKEWIDCLVTIIKERKSINKSNYEDIKRKFIYKATTFWLKAEKISSKECEKLIINQANIIKNQIMGVL